MFFSIAQKLEPNLKHQNKALQYCRCGLVRRKKHMPHTIEKIDYTGLHFSGLTTVQHQHDKMGSLLWNNQKTKPSLCFKTASQRAIYHEITTPRLPIIPGMGSKLSMVQKGLSPHPGLAPAAEHF